MKTNWLHGLTVLLLLGLLVFGYYWYNREVIVGSAEEYIGSENMAVAPASMGVKSASPTPTATIELTPEEKIANPTLNQGTTVYELKNDLDQTIIEEEDFSNL